MNDNTDATAQDAQTLREVYNKLKRRIKNLADAQRRLKKAWLISDDAVTDARGNRDIAQMQLDETMSQSWVVLKGLPKGTNAPGGGTPQSVAMQFYNTGVNRELNARMSASDARRKNSRSFG